MGQMHQMQLTYVPTEDRLLFRMNTKSRQEFRFWMTRRYVGMLWHSLTNIISKAEKSKEEPTEKPAPVDPIVESAKVEMKHQEMVSKADFKTQYQESTYLPLGEQPGLLYSIAIKSAPNGQALLCMHPQKGEGVELALNEQILHSLCKLIAETTQKAGWKLELKFVERKSDDDSPGGLN